MYLADEAILGDKEFVSRVLAESLAHEQQADDGHRDAGGPQHTSSEGRAPAIET